MAAPAVTDPAPVDPFAAVADGLADLCDGILATAGQLYAWTAEQAVEVVAGRHHHGAPVDPTDVAEVFCLAKPIVAAATLLALERAGIPADTPVDALLGRATALGPDVHPVSIINHDARLRVPSAAAWILTPPHQRPALSAVRPEPGVARAYSEVSGWRLLAIVLRAVTGVDPADWIAAEVLRPLGLDRTVLLTPTGMAEAAAAGRVLAPLGGLPAAPVPLLHVHAPGYRARCGPTFGGLASATAIGTFTAAMVDAFHGDPQPGLPSPACLHAVVEAAGPTAPDATWQRPTRFALGYEQRHPTAGSGAGTWRLSGFVTTALVQVDPDTNTGVCLVLDGLLDTPDELSLRWHRCAALLDRLPTAAP